MSLRRRHGSGQLPFNLMPLIDMALMLTVFFVLCLAASGVAQRAVPVALPAAASGSEAGTAPLEVVIDAQGSISVAGRAASLEALAAMAGSGRAIAIVADRAVAHGRVVEAVDALRQGGARDIHYAVTYKVAEW